MARRVAFKVDARLVTALAALISAFSPQLETLVHGALLRTGSANWFPTGLKRQDNDLRYEADPALARQCEARFTEIVGVTASRRCSSSA